MTKTSEYPDELDLRPQHNDTQSSAVCVRTWPILSGNPPSPLTMPVCLPHKAETDYEITCELVGYVVTMHR